MARHAQNPGANPLRPERSSLGSQVSRNLYTALFLWGPIFPPDLPALVLSANGPELFTLQSHDQLSTSRAEPCNVFDMELGKLRNGTERLQFESTEPTEKITAAFQMEDLAT